MTVFPSTRGLKSDKVPLVDAAAAPPSQPQQPPPPYDPSSLESGDLIGSAAAAAAGHLPPKNVRFLGGDGDADRRCRHWAYKRIRAMLTLLMIMMVMWMVVYFYSRELCDGCRERRELAAEVEAQNLAAVSADDDDGDVDPAAANVPCKTYNSFAAAENDMLSAVPLSPAVDKFNDMFALNRQVMDNDVLSMDMEIESPVDGGGTGTGTGTGVDVVDGKSRGSSPVLVTKSARFIHDFSVNVTGIVDVEGQRCFVMPLMRNSVSPPASLYDLLFKMSSGYYSMDIKKVMSDMRMVKPAVKDLSGYGLYISKDCADYSTFKLEKIPAIAAAASSTSTAVADV